MTLTRLFLRTSSIALAFTAVATASQAATYGSLANFLAANTADVTEDFQSYADATVGFTGPLATPSGIEISTPTNDMFMVGTGQSSNTSTAVGSNYPRSDYLILALGGDFSAMGFDLYQNDGGGSQTGSIQPFTISAYLSGNLVTQLSTGVAPNGGSFFGFDDIGTFDKVTISSDNGLFEVIDNIVLSSAMPAVPLPASGLLLLGGIASAGALRRRKSKPASAAQA